MADKNGVKQGKVNVLVGCFCGGSAEVKTGSASNHRGPTITVYYGACTECSMYDHVQSASIEIATERWNYLMQPNDKMRREKQTKLR